MANREHQQKNAFTDRRKADGKGVDMHGWKRREKLRRLRYLKTCTSK